MSIVRCGNPGSGQHTVGERTRPARQRENTPMVIRVRVNVQQPRLKRLGNPVDQLLVAALGDVGYSKQGPAQRR